MSKAETDEKALPEKILTDTTDNRLQITGEAPLNSPYQETAAKASIIPPNDEGKFFSHDQWSDGPEVVKELSPLYSITPGLPTSVSHSPSDPTLEVASNLEPVKRKFGLRRRVFWGLVLIAVIILGAAVGGGIGGGLASKYRSEKARETILFTMARSRIPLQPQTEANLKLTSSFPIVPPQTQHSCNPLPHFWSPPQRTSPRAPKEWASACKSGKNPNTKAAPKSSIPPDTSAPPSSHAATCGTQANTPTPWKNAPWPSVSMISRLAGAARPLRKNKGFPRIVPGAPTAWLSSVLLISRRRGVPAYRRIR